jgi:DNA polymerase-3 subunit epsilon
VLTDVGHGFAVVDVETTGLSSKLDRVAEIAVVSLNADLEVEDEFVTLINPLRDIGQTRWHGITAADVVDAPRFVDAVDVIWRRLAKRVFVAHNVSFDWRMIDAELERSGWRAPQMPTLCTMRLARSYIHDLERVSLDSCCEAAGVEMTQHHSALSDAKSAAQLLTRYAQTHGELPSSWRAELESAARTSWDPSPAPTDFRPLTREMEASRRAQERSPLGPLLHTLPRGPILSVEPYLSVLARALEDRLLDGAELAVLRHLAEEHELTRDEAETAHREYLRQVANAAWADLTLTEAERQDLLSVARLLEVPEDEALQILDAARETAGRAVRASGSVNALRAGDKVVFTGEMSVPREQLEAIAAEAGLRAMGNVSSKTALLVMADPHSQSGKARTARKAGVRTVTEQVFMQLCHGVQPAVA